MKQKDALAFAFLDTNIFLHFTYFDQVDWPRELRYREVCLVIAPSVLGELEKYKYDRDSQRRQERSRKVSRQLFEIANSAPFGVPAPISTRPGVTLLVLTDSPNITAHAGLQPGVQDDHLLASVLKFREARADITVDDVLLIADDTGLLVKARAHSIPTHRLRDELRLPDEPTKDQQERRRLERELATLKEREPALKLAFRHENQVVELLTVDLQTVQDLPDGQVEELCRIEEEATLWPRRKQPEEGVGQGGSDVTTEVPPYLADMVRAGEQTRRMVESMALSFGSNTSEQELERYERERQEYLEAYRTYIGNAYLWERLRGLSKRIHLLVANDGKHPALGVVVRIVIPDGITVLDPDDWPSPPEPPARPVRPRSALEQMASYLQAGADVRFPSSLLSERLSNLGPQDPDQAGPSITPYNSTLVKWERSKVMHGLPLDLTPLILVLPPAPEDRIYELHYQLHAENLATPAEGILKIVARSLVLPFQPPPIQPRGSQA